MPAISDDDWLVRGIRPENIKRETGVIKSGDFNYADGISVFKLTLRAVTYLLRLHQYERLAPLKSSYCQRDLGLTIVSDPSEEIDDEARDDHFLIRLDGLTSSRRQKIGKALRDHAQPLSISIRTSPDEAFRELRERCDGFDRA